VLMCKESKVLITGVLIFLFVVLSLPEDIIYDKQESGNQVHAGEETMIMVVHRAVLSDNDEEKGKNEEEDDSVITAGYVFFLVVWISILYALFIMTRMRSKKGDD